jgi:hypothetical protein
VVWQSLDADPRSVSARSAAERLDQGGRATHLVWNPLTGDIVQLIPIVRAARSLVSVPATAGPYSPPGRTGPAAVAEVNKEGRVCAQICVVALSQEPFTAGPMNRQLDILNWLDSWGVPRRWPAGRPASFPDCHVTARSRRLWARGGHFGESQVPGLTAAGPGAIDVERLTGWSAAHAATSRPADIAEFGPTGRPQAHAGRPNGFRPEALGEFLGRRVATATALTRVP